jgi:alpha-mannosidase
MIGYVGRIADLKPSCTGYWGERALAQADYTARLSETEHGRFDAVVSAALDELERALEAEGAVGRTACLEMERTLLPAAGEAKALEMLCAAHAHIDMNWMWGYAETVALTLDTFRTMLNLMDEYPEFTFSQSQASVYRIVEEHDPGMLAEIRRRVQEGRWEVTASTWVETDKNMPSGESLARHILYTKRYLGGLFGLAPESLDLDFEPDTFGHNANVPEILAKGGVRHYYHCRGYEGHHLYRWRSASGAEAVVYREPLWYNATIDAGIAAHVPAFCAKHGMSTVLKVYGVGDHGGGPTRRDIERLQDMAAWPVFPTIKFGTFTAYFRKVDEIAATLPIVDHELNFIFTGCYTTQTRIKAANRIGEARMDDAERFAAAAAVSAGVPYPRAAYEEAWRKILFNHFHDILPGSGTIETREYAMGQFQEVVAVADQGTVKALRGIDAKVDTESLPAVKTARAELKTALREAFSEGAGVGYAVGDYVVPQPERGRGRVRILHFHNPSTHSRSEVVHFTVWDWPGDPARIEILDAGGTQLPFRLEPSTSFKFFGKGEYWGHHYLRILARISVPAIGHATAVLREKADMGFVQPHDEPRVERPDVFVLENALVRAEFDPATAALRSLRDMRTGRELVAVGRHAGFRLIDEDGSKGMTAWVVGRYMNVVPLVDDVCLTPVRGGPDALRSAFSYTVPFRGSKLTVEVSLSKDSDRIEYAVICDYRETAVVGRSVPQLNFTLPVAYECMFYRYDIPFGTVDREPLDMDVPASSFGMALPEESGIPALAIIAATKYGFRGTDDSVSLTLIRSSFDPDPTPEFGEHRFRFAVRVTTEPEDRREALAAAFDFSHPLIYQSGTVHSGVLPAEGSFLSLLGGTAVVTAVKLPEDAPGGRSVLVRLHETDGREGTAVLRFDRPVRSASIVDINEKPIPSALGLEARCDGNQVLCPLAPWSVTGFIAELD